MGKGYMRVAAGITIFSVFFSMIVISGGIADFTDPDKLQNSNITRDDLRFSPDLPTVQADEIDLKNDVVDSDGVNISETTNVQNAEYNTEYTVQVENGSSYGWVLYRLQGDTEVIETWVSRVNFLASSKVRLETYETADSTSQIDSLNLKGETLVDLDTNENYVLFNLTETDGRLYYVNEQTGSERGFIDTLTAYAESGATAMASWFVVVSGLPPALFWLGAALTIIAVLIVLEIVLW